MTETKSRLGRLVEHLEERFGDAADELGLRLHLDGCPHACAQHWVGDIGFQGTTARDDDGKRRQAYDIYVRGGLGPEAQIGTPLFRRVPTEELDAAVDGLVAGWLGRSAEGEGFPRSRRPDRRGARRARGPGACAQRAREEEAA